MPARNIVLIVILKDTNCSEEGIVMAWKAFHDFCLNEKSGNVVKDTAAKLVRSSDSLERWHQSPYGSLIRIINVESLEGLHTIWTKYANHVPPDTAFKRQIRSKTVKYSAYYKSERSY